MNTWLYTAEIKVIIGSVKFEYDIKWYIAEFAGAIEYTECFSAED